MGSYVLERDLVSRRSQFHSGRKDVVESDHIGSSRAEKMSVGSLTQNGNFISALHIWFGICQRRASLRLRFWWLAVIDGLILEFPVFLVIF